MVHEKLVRGTQRTLISKENKGFKKINQYTMCPICNYNNLDSEK